MHTSPAPQDRSIRSIFSSAMGLEEKPKTLWQRIVATCDTDLVRHGALGASAGAVLSVVAFTAILAAMPRHDMIETASLDTGRIITVDGPKADRMAVPGGKLAAVAVAPTFVDRSAGDISIGAPGRFLTLGQPISYAGQATVTAAVGAIDKAFSQPPVVMASLGDTSITPPMNAPDSTAAAIAEEDDDTNIIPIPRARPERALAAPLPRPRPIVPVMLTQTSPNTEVAEAEMPGPPPPRPSEPPPGLRPAPGQILGFFSSPTEPVKAPSKTISIDTPFGVPYVLQQASVETACLKPELVDILRKVENHYQKKVVITSGFRDRGRQGSLHRQCAAADIEIPGVTAAALAAFARTIPDIGGVGTYCHPNMIHVDVGTPRDWKFGCGGSFFAMRGGAPGKWGKVPAALARLSTRNAPSSASEAED